MRRAILVAVLLSLCGCNDEDKTRALAACRVKGVAAVGPMPSPCIKEVDDPDYEACVKRSADKITSWEYQYSPFVDDCMRVAGYTIRKECLGFSAVLRERTDCYE